MFVRKASGLLKSWSGVDAFIYSALAVNLVSLGFYYGLSNAPFSPEGSILTAVIAAAIGVSFLVVVYAGLISTMPRAGGDYLWQSRTLGGGIAFVLAITGWCFILWHWAPIYADILVVQVLQPLLITLGLPDAVTWLSEDTGVFVASLAVIFGVGILVAVGMDVYKRFQKVAFWGAVLGLLTMFALLLFSSQGAFQDAVNRESADLLGASGDVYSRTIDKAALDVEGFGFGGDFSASMLLVPFVLFFLLYPNWGATLYGEVRGASSFRRVFMPMFAGLWVTVLATVIFLALVDKTMGWDFFMAANNNYWSFSSALTGAEPAIFPFPGLLTAWLVDNAVLQVILLLLLSLWFLAWAGSLFLSSTRVIFATAFDRILPEWAASVSERRRVPVGALAIMLVPSIPISAMYAYSDDFASYTLAATLVIAVTFLGSGLAAIALPLRRPEMWRNSPASRIRLGPIPLVPVAGVIMVGFLGWAVYKWLTEDLYALNSSDSLIYMGSLYVVAALVYGVALLVRARQGVRLSAVQGEIPAD
jgi:basic amino acid/polyamine antiporter, APA family